MGGHHYRLGEYSERGWSENKPMMIWHMNTRECRQRVEGGVVSCKDPYVRWDMNNVVNIGWQQRLEGGRMLGGTFTTWGYKIDWVGNHRLGYLWTKGRDWKGTWEGGKVSWHTVSMEYVFRLWEWASCQIRKIAGAHAPGMPGTFSPSPQVSDPDMHHDTCVTHVPWCMPGLLISGLLWNRRRGKTFPAFLAHAQPASLRIW